MATQRELEAALKQVQRRKEKRKAERSQRREQLDEELVVPLEQQIRAARSKVEEIIAAEFPPSDTNQIDEDLHIAESRLNEARVKNATDNKLIGQTFRRWHRKYGKQFYQTDDVAIIAVFDGTNIGRKTSRWIMPEVGQLFLRSIKKDGKPGLMCLGLIKDDKLPGNWYPSGIDPNEKE